MTPALPASPALRRLGRAAPSLSEMELLRAAACHGAGAVRAWQRWAAHHDLDDAPARSVALLPAVCANVSAPDLGVDAGRLAGIRRRTWADDRSARQALDGAVREMGALGVSPVVTGSAVLAGVVYPEPGTRVVSGFDLALGDVAESDLAAIVAALETVGWSRRRDVDSPFDHVIDVDDGQGRTIRLHRWLLFPRFAAAPELPWFDRTVSMTMQGHSLRRFRPADELVATVLDGLLVTTAGATWPLDVAMLVGDGASGGTQVADRFWQAVVESASELGAGPIVADALEMCRVELGVPVPSEVIAELHAADADAHLRRRWALRRRGVTAQWRTTRYRRMTRHAGARPTPWGYGTARMEAVRARGLRTAIGDRVARAGRFVDEHRRR